jgi:drug/metabolite transporter superfamily protein YnfA
MNRILPAATLFWIACTAIVNTAVYAAAVYMRAHREEPMLPVSVVSALLTFAVITLLKNDVTNMMFGYSAINVCVSLPWTFFLYQRYRDRHRPLPLT